MSDNKLAERLQQLGLISFEEQQLFSGEQQMQDLLTGNVTPCECVFCGQGFLVVTGQFRHLMEPCTCVATRMNNMRGPFRWIRNSPRYKALADKGYAIVGIRRRREWTWLGSKNVYIELRVRHFLTGLDFAHRVNESDDWSLTPIRGASWLSTPQKRVKSRMRKERMGSLYFCLEMLAAHIRRWEIDEINRLRQFHRHS